MTEARKHRPGLFTRLMNRLALTYISFFSSQAKRLNDELYSDVRSLPEEAWEEFSRKIRNYCNLREYKADYIDTMWIPHRYRLYLSIKWLEDIIQKNNIQHALDLGWGTPATDLFKEYFPNVDWCNTEGDLRYRWKMQNESVDLIVCTELLEHVADIPEGINDSFKRTGLRAVLQECHRVLKPHGWLFITTPNATSVLHIERIFMATQPWFFSEHIREYEPSELLKELRESNFSISRWRTVHCLTAGDKKDFTWIFQFLLASSSSVTDRGDDIFVIARKDLV